MTFRPAQTSVLTASPTPAIVMTTALVQSQSLPVALALESQIALPRSIFLSFNCSPYSLKSKVAPFQVRRLLSSFPPSFFAYGSQNTSRLRALIYSEKEKPNSEIYLDPEGGPNKIGFCEYLEYYWSRGDRFWVTVGGNTRSPLQHVAYQYPGKDSAYNAEFVLLDKEVNRVKEGVSCNVQSLFDIY